MFNAIPDALTDIIAKQLGWRVDENYHAVLVLAESTLEALRKTHGKELENGWRQRFGFRLAIIGLGYVSPLFRRQHQRRPAHESMAV